MRLFAAPAIGAFAKAALLTSAALVAHEDTATRPVLSGAWSIDKTLSTAPGSVGMPDDGTDGPGPGGGGRRRGGGPGGGFPGGMGGGGGRGAPGGIRGREEDRAARRALLEELIALPPKFTIAQDGDKVVFIEPDGVVRTFVVNDKAEKHQLQNGTIETKSRWDGNALEMELKSLGRPDPHPALRSPRDAATARSDDHGQPRAEEREARGGLRRDRRRRPPPPQ